MSEKNKVIVVGGGLCGTLLAIRLRQRGFETLLFEKRPDMRKEEISAGRSINLALSNRGLRALEMIGLREKAKEITIPMKGRNAARPGGQFAPFALQRPTGRPHQFHFQGRPQFHALR